MPVLFSMPRWCLTILLAFLFTSCAQESQRDDSTVIQVNNYSIGLEEFNALIRFQAHADPEMELTNESRDRFVDYLVSKELMLQEASRLELDREKDFIRTIEKYWEATLIRNLLEQKTARFQEQVLVTDDQVRSYYLKHKDELGQSLSEAQGAIKTHLRSKAVENKINDWVQSLRLNADISINTARLNGE